MQKIAFTIASATAFLLGSTAAQADLIGAYANIDYWNAGGSTQINQAGTQQNFDHDDKGLASLSVSIEHPAPLLPNAKLRYVQLKNDTNATQFAGTPFVANTRLDIDVSNTDFLAYYEILDNVVSVDAGLGLKQLNGDVDTTSLLIPANTTRIKVKESIPVVYASVGGRLPFTGFSAKAEMLIGQNQDANTSDLQAEVKYDVIDNVAFDVGIKAGYRVLKVELENVNATNVDLDFKGPYLGLEMHF